MELSWFLVVEPAVIACTMCLAILLKMIEKSSWVKVGWCILPIGEMVWVELLMGLLGNKVVVRLLLLVTQLLIISVIILSITISPTSTTTSSSISVAPVGVLEVLIYSRELLNVDRSFGVLDRYCAKICVMKSMTFGCSLVVETMLRLVVVVTVVLPVWLKSWPCVHMLPDLWLIHWIYLILMVRLEDLC